MGLTVGAFIVAPIAGVALHVSAIYAARPVPGPSLEAYVTENSTVGLRWSVGSDPVGERLGWQYQVKESLGAYGSWISVPGDPTKRSVVLDLRDNGIEMAFRVRAALPNGGFGRPSNEARVDLSATKAADHLAEIAERCVGCPAAPTDEAPRCESPVELGVFYFPHGSSEPCVGTRQCDVDACAGVDDGLGAIDEHLRTTADHLLLEGYATYPGARGYNLALSETRAEAIVRRLLDREPAHCGRLHVVANGEDVDGHFGPSQCRRMVRVLACRNAIESVKSRFCAVCEGREECSPSAPSPRS